MINKRTLLPLALLVSLLSAPQAFGAAKDQDKEDVQNSIIRYKAAIGVNPSNPATRVKLGKMYLISGDVDGAIDEFKKAIKLSASDAEAHLGLARAYIRKRDYAGAANSLREAIKLEPNNAEYHYKLGQVHSQRQNDEDAIAEFRQAIRFNPSHAGAHRELGAALGIRGDLDAQIAEEKKAIAIAPNDADSLYYLGSAFLAQDKPADAQKCFEKCVTLDQRHAEGYHLLAVTQAAQNDWGSAVRSEETAVRLQPDNEGFKSTLRKLKQKSLPLRGK